MKSTVCGVQQHDVQQDDACFVCFFLAPHSGQRVLPEKQEVSVTHTLSILPQISRLIRVAV